MEVHEDQKYIRALCNNNSALIEEIYEKCSPQCMNYILKNNGTVEDAKSVFQNTMIEVVKNCAKLTLTAPICAYLYSVYRRAWLNELKIRKRILRNKDKIVSTYTATNSLDLRLAQEKMEKIYMDCFDKQPEDYKKLHKLRYVENKSSKEIAVILNIGHNTVDQRLFYYKEKLKKCAENHPDYNELML